MSHWALALCVVPAFPTLLCLHLMDPPDPYICRHSTSVRPRATCLQRGSIYAAASFCSHRFRWTMACSQQWWELHHVFSTHGSEHRCWKHTSDRFSGLAAITTRSTSHMHVFSAAGSEKEVLSRHQCIFQIPLSPRSQFFSSPLLVISSPAVVPPLRFLFLSSCLPRSLGYFQPLLCRISCCAVYSPTSTPAERPGRVHAIPQQGHTAAWDWRAVQPDAFCSTALCVCLSVDVGDLRDGGMGLQKEWERGRQSKAEATRTALLLLSLHN